jgi:hypothetical protein
MYATQISKHFVPDSSATVFNLTVGGPQIDIYCCEPNKQVIDQYRRETAKFALYEHQGVLYFLSNFANNGWMEAPFHASMNPQQLAGVPAEYVEGRHHFLLAVTLKDSSSNVTYGARFVTLSKEMSARLVKVVRMQLAAPITRQDYESRVEGAFSRHTASQMARLAIVRCTGGGNEPAANEPSMSDAKGMGEPVSEALVQEFIHITLLTGHECRQRAEEVDPQESQFIIGLIEDSQLNGWTELELEGRKYPVHMAIEGSNLTCRLCLPCFAVEHPLTAVLIAVALDAVKGQDCWRAMHVAVSELTTTDASQPPSDPWIAAMPMADALIVDCAQGGRVSDYLSMMQWAGDFERSLAFGFAHWRASR